ncbi:hypothetical protein C8R45DRAFT_932470 [Mycena sanguinolenta]|nr:hypothetical protein C8R45DRAFT_932470 [Mycena sanguinolenta]
MNAAEANGTKTGASRRGCAGGQSVSTVVSRCTRGRRREGDVIDGHRGPLSYNPRVERRTSKNHSASYLWWEGTSVVVASAGRVEVGTGSKSERIEFGVVQLQKDDDTSTRQEKDGRHGRDGAGALGRIQPTAAKGGSVCNGCRGSIRLHRDGLGKRIREAILARIEAKVWGARDSVLRSWARYSVGDDVLRDAPEANSRDDAPKNAAVWTKVTTCDLEIKPTRATFWMKVPVSSPSTRQSLRDAGTMVAEQYEKTPGTCVLAQRLILSRQVLPYQSPFVSGWDATGISKKGILPFPRRTVFRSHKLFEFEFGVDVMPGFKGLPVVIVNCYLMGTRKRHAPRTPHNTSVPSPAARRWIAIAAERPLRAKVPAARVRSVYVGSKGTEQNAQALRAPNCPPACVAWASGTHDGGWCTRSSAVSARSPRSPHRDSPVQPRAQVAAARTAAMRGPHHLGDRESSESQLGSGAPERETSRRTEAGAGRAYEFTVTFSRGAHGERGQRRARASTRIQPQNHPNRSCVASVERGGRGRNLHIPSRSSERGECGKAGFLPRHSSPHRRHAERVALDGVGRGSGNARADVKVTAASYPRGGLYAIRSRARADAHDFLPRLEYHCVRVGWRTARCVVERDSEVGTERERERMMSELKRIDRLFIPFGSSRRAELASSVPHANGSGGRPALYGNRECTSDRTATEGYAGGWKIANSPTHLPAPRAIVRKTSTVGAKRTPTACVDDAAGAGHIARLVRAGTQHRADVDFSKYESVLVYLE